jgi:CRISPR-associated protein Cmr1
MPKPDDIPLCPKAPQVRSSALIVREFPMRLVTPMFGGGVEPGQPDETLPIRATSIRGHLQFWWRATRGAQFGNSRGLFAAHAEVWGTTEKASPVEVEVREIEASAPEVCQSFERNGRPQFQWNSPFDSKNRELWYVLFPFQGELSGNRREVKKEPGRFIRTASFTLRLRFPAALREDVESAVWAWANFGGLGARTRRGCGALLCKELAPKEIGDLDRWFRAGPVGHGGSVRDWPTLPAKVIVGKRTETPFDAWRKAAELLQSFRQGEGIARNPGTQEHRRGRSRYPEPETIRRVTRQRPTRHPRLTAIPDDAFPRAELGLPMVFHFQGQGEPPQTELYPLNQDGSAGERMATPLILKPLAMADGTAVPLLMRLVTKPLSGVRLKHRNQELTFPATAVRSERLAAYPNSPLRLSPSGSALEAFVLYARDLCARGTRDREFREIVR